MKNHMKYFTVAKSQKLEHKHSFKPHKIYTIPSNETNLNRPERKNLF